MANKTIRQLTNQASLASTDAFEIETSGNVSRYVLKSDMAGSETTPGFLELATAAETTTGTDATRAISPDGLAGSDYGKRCIGMYVVDAATSLTVADGVGYFPPMPAALNGYNLVGARITVITTSSSGTPTVQIARGRQASATAAHTFADMLSTRLTIDANEYCSADAAAAAVIDTTKDDIATNDIIRVDVDVTGTGTKGLLITLDFQLP
jgi:hypothetical protein